jgi:hypothetical protein
MNEIIQNIPNISKYPLHYIFEDLKYSHKENTLWLEFGVATGNTINYISKHTNNMVYGFDSFFGLPEKWRDGFDKESFSRNGELPIVNNNVILVKGLFQDTLEDFLKTKNMKISFIHIDCDLYSSTKYILNMVHKYLDKDCIIVFDELVNYDGYDGDNGELRAFYEFLNDTNIKYKWIGMNGTPFNMRGYYHENVALYINI